MVKKHRVMLAKLLRAAVHDAQKLEKMPGFKINMDVFCRPQSVPGTIGGFGFTPPPITICEVCLGGAYALLHLKAEQPAMGDWKFTDNTEAQRMANVVNFIREGQFLTALNTLGVRDLTSESLDERVGKARALLEPYKYGVAPWEVYLKAADVLEGVL